MANNFRLNQYYLYSKGNQTHFARVFEIFKHQICSARLIYNVYFDFASHPLILGEKSLPFTHGDTLNLFFDILSSSLAKVKCCHCNLSELVSQYISECWRLRIFVVSHPLLSCPVKFMYRAEPFFYVSASHLRAGLELFLVFAVLTGRFEWITYSCSRRRCSHAH